MGSRHDSEEDEPPNSGLWGKVELEDLPNPTSVPPPPLAAGQAIARKGTLMGFAVPADESSGAVVRAFRRTPASGSSAPPGSLPADPDPIPATSPLGGMPPDTVLAPGGSLKARGYHRSDNPARTLIGGTVRAPEGNTERVPQLRPGASPHATTPGFSALPDASKGPGQPTTGLTGAGRAAPSTTATNPTGTAPLAPSKETLIGVAMPQAVLDALRATANEINAPAAVQTPRVGVADRARTSRPPSEPGSSRSANHLGRFRIQKRLGAGGAGAVYLARKVDDSVGEQKLAIKVLREHVYQDPAALKALFREARLAARMDHRHIVRVMDIGYHKRQPYLVMEYVDGLSLAALMAHPIRVPLPIGIRCLIDALHGLDYAHKLRGDEGEPLGLVHCDVSPQNMLVGADGVTKVTDFGVARTREEDGDEFVLRCKPEYAAPELLQGEPVRPETDVYSAGAVLYRLATGRAAFPGDSDEEVIHKVLTTRPPSISKIKPGEPRWLDDFCEQAMAPHYADRFRSCLEMARALERQAETANLLADRAAVGEWVQRVRRSLEGEENFALSELGTIIDQNRSTPPNDKASTAPPPGEEDVQSLAAKLGLGITGAVLVAGALIWFLLSPASFKSFFSAKRQPDAIEAASAVDSAVPGPSSATAPGSSPPPASAPAIASTTSAPPVPLLPATASAPNESPPEKVAPPLPAPRRAPPPPPAPARIVQPQLAPSPVEKAKPVAVAPEPDPTVTSVSQKAVATPRGPSAPTLGVSPSAVQPSIPSSATPLLTGPVVDPARGFSVP